MAKGQIISGSFSAVIARQKYDEAFEIGELLIAENKKTKILMQVVDLCFGSQISQPNLELISGIRLEEGAGAELMDEKLRFYTLATLKNILAVQENKSAKIMPAVFSELREVNKDDLKFAVPENPLFMGYLRSGSKVLDVPVFLNGKDVLSHHLLIPATTGRGKSNLTSVMLWSIAEKDYAGVLVLDPHDEYYERLRSHPKKERIIYYSPSNVPAGERTLKINLKLVKPDHFNGIGEWTTPQKECLSLAYKKYGEQWVEMILVEKEIKNIQEATLSVVKRRLCDILNIRQSGKELFCEGVFDLNAGEAVIRDIVVELEKSGVVIVNTSSLSGRTELLIGSLIAGEIFARYRHHKMSGVLSGKPVISIILEEAPRVLGKDAIDSGPNIFSTIAREGRKFQVGLIAITQLPSLIPRQILANMNTKIILGIEMAPERQAVIESASQDLSDDNRNIASLDKGEAIITSNFAPFAVPVKIPLFRDFSKNKEEKKISFSGIKIV
jgi:DNA helicase HerA-like ATPase